MASKHVVNGRRTLKAFESHIEKCKAPSTSNPLPVFADVDAEVFYFEELTHQEIGDRISVLKKTWFCKDGSGKHVAAGRRLEQQAARVELIQLRAEFKRRLEALS